MFNPKTILFLGITVLVLGGGIFYLTAHKKTAAPASVLDQQVPTTTTKNSSTATGTVGTVPQVAFNVHTDPSQPFTDLRPRQGEGDETFKPTPVTGKGTGSGTTATAPQSIDPADYSKLTASQFLAKYYPDASNVISGQAAASIQNAAGNGLVISKKPGVQSITDISGISSANFKQSTDNSKTNISNYLQNVNTATAPLDLVNNPQLALDILQNPDATAIAAQLKSAQTVMASVQNISSPTSLTGMNKEIFVMYQAYAQMLTDINSAGALPVKGQIPDPNAIAGKIQTDANNFTQAFSQVQLDQNIVAQNLQVQ